MATPRFVSPTNTFLPQATGQVIGYIRDPKEFNVNRYVQLIEAPAPVFVYPVLEKDQSIRIAEETEFAWEDGDMRPTGHHNLSRFSWTEGRCFRRDFPYTLGLQAVQTARKVGAFDPELVESKSVSSQAMTYRTNRVIKGLQTTANWSGNTADANTLNGGVGKWDAASGDPSVTAHYLAIKKTLMAAAQKIHLGTNGKVKWKDLRLVLSPITAMAMANTGEIHDYLKFNSNSTKIVEEGGLANPNEMWGLPATLYGIEVVVEDSPIVTVHSKADGSLASISSSERTYIKDSDSAILMSRVGGIDAPYGAPNFSTLQLYWYQYEMAVESREDTWNKLVEGHVVEQVKEVIAASDSGYLITDVLT